MGEITNRDAILKKVSVLFEKMHQNQKLQQLAEQNNLDIKNTIKLTDDNMMNVAVTLVALSLAKEANDPRYKKLVNTGLQKRSLKLEIINDYKKEANDIIKDYSSGNFNKEPIQEGFKDFTDETSNEIKSFIVKELNEVYDDWTSVDIRAIVSSKAYCIEVFFIKGKIRKQCYELCDDDIINEDKLMDAFKNIAHKIRTTDEYKESCEYKKCFNVENSESVQEGFLDIFKNKS